MFFGNIYKYLQESTVKEAILNEIYSNKLEFCLPMFNEAWDSFFWRDKGYDGASFVTDKYHPRLANFLHDYAYRCGMANYHSDYIYKKLLTLTGESAFEVNKRYMLIRSFGSYYRVKHYILKGLQKSSENQRNLYKILKNI